jgi:polyhydroxyalkanoate synthesis regulator phasin
MATTNSLLKQLNPFSSNASSAVAEAATKVAKYAAQVQSGDITLDEFKELSSDLEALKESATEAGEVADVQTVNEIFNGLVQVLSKV